MYSDAVPMDSSPIVFQMVLHGNFNGVDPTCFNPWARILEVEDFPLVRRVTPSVLMA